MRQGGQGPCRYYIHTALEIQDKSFEPAVMHGRRRLRQPRRMPQESTFAGIAFHKMDMESRPIRSRYGDHQAGEPCARAQVKPSAPVCQCQKLQRIRDMSRPDLIEGCRSDEILDRLPTGEFFHKEAELAQRFT